MITFESKGELKRTEQFLQKMNKGDLFAALEQYGRAGVAALASATPHDSGLTAASWNYEISRSRGSYRITWTNTNTVDGLPIAIMLQYGHGTGTGGWVQGRDYINPAIRPIFDKIAESVWKAVTSA
jgi:hypothetical protein